MPQSSTTMHLSFALLTGLLGSSCTVDEKYAVENGEWLSGGETTNTFLLGVNAFIMPAENMTIEHEPSFYTGNSFFNQAWVQTPASTQNRDGLGPLFNARSCAACHFKDGRGEPPEEGESFLGLLLRISLPNGDPDPNYGNQIQPFAIDGVESEATPTLSTMEIEGSYPDGEIYTLSIPEYKITELAHGPLADDLRVSPRVAPAVIGMGLLEAISVERLQALEDPDDEDGDGISGRIHWVKDPVSGEEHPGRFGWKGEEPTVLSQTAGAFLGDIGITTPILPENNCPENPTECQEQENGGEPEIREELFDKVVLYTSLVAVPIRRDWEDKTVLRGKGLFHDIGCASCHVSSHTTDNSTDFEETHQQLIWPYTDLLLHDMGPDLSDNRPILGAEAREWKTPPLWGIGLIDSVNKHSRFLHDGRARNLTEAILWHGGEAEASKNAFKGLPKSDRNAIITFLESL